LGLVERTRGALNAALTHVERAIIRADSIGAIEEMPPMFAVLVFLNRRTKRFDEAFAAAKRGIELCRQTPKEKRNHVWKNNVVESLLGLAVGLLCKRRLRGAERTYRQVCRMVSESTEPQQLSLAYNGIAGLRMMQGDPPGARTFLLRSIRLKERLGEPHQLAIAYSNLTELELRMGNTAAAVEHAKRSVKFGELARAEYDLAEMYQNLARALLASNDVGSALDAAARALTIASESGPIYLAGVAHIVAQCCSRVAKEADSSSAHLAKAASLALTLSQVLPRLANDAELTQRAEEWRALIEPLLMGRNN
jgi:tetratricopeptide (TPR) repeat protein